MAKKTIIGFEVDESFKQRIIRAAKDFEIDGVNYPLKLSGFCRIATERFLKDVERKDKK